jgi:hypothetical protein
LPSAEASPSSPSRWALEPDASSTTIADLMTMHPFFCHPMAVRALSMMLALPFYNRHIRQRENTSDTFLGIADDEVGAVVLCWGDTAMTAKSDGQSDREPVEMQIGSGRDMRDRCRVGAGGHKPTEGEESENDEGDTG